MIRKHALGNFPDMLRASTKSGAMAWYLDNLYNYAKNRLTLRNLHNQIRSRLEGVEAPAVR